MLKRMRDLWVGDQRGAVTAEVAIVLPILMLTMFAGFEFSRLHVVRHSADIAAYDASRHVIVPGATANEAIAKANAILSIVGVKNATVTVNPNPMGVDTEEVTVTVSIPLGDNGWIMPGLTYGKTVERSATLRTERQMPPQQP